MAAIDAIRDVAPHARIVHVDPLINVVNRPGAAEATASTVPQPLTPGRSTKRLDMIAGRALAATRGDPSYLDIIGGNYYVHNQWELDGQVYRANDTRYRPLSHLLNDLLYSLRKPVFIAETGIEENRRAEWLAYICGRSDRSTGDGRTPVEGICLYPIVNHPGWDDDRHCHNGLWDYCNEFGPP